MVDFSLYLITDRTQTAGRELPAVVAEALAGGIRAVQLREKDLNGRELFQLAATMRELTSRYGAKLFINSRLDVAMAVSADGVHLGASTIPVASARRVVGTGLLIGYSAHSPAEAAEAEKEGADFVTFGPVYPTPSKAAYGVPAGPGKLSETASLLKIPVFALGGITGGSIGEAIRCGASGIALISAVMTAPSPSESARELLGLTERSLHEYTSRQHTS